MGGHYCTLSLGPPSAGIDNGAEPIRVQAFIAETAIEALHMGLVCGLARTTEFEADTWPYGHGVQCVARELWSIVHLQQTKPI